MLKYQDKLKASKKGIRTPPVSRSGAQSSQPTVDLTEEDPPTSIHEDTMLLRWRRLIKKIKPYLEMGQADWELLEAKAMLDDSETIQMPKRTREVA